MTGIMEATPWRSVEKWPPEERKISFRFQRSEVRLDIAANVLATEPKVVMMLGTRDLPLDGPQVAAKLLRASHAKMSRTDYLTFLSFLKFCYYWRAHRKPGEPLRVSPLLIGVIGKYDPRNERRRSS